VRLVRVLFRTKRSGRAAAKVYANYRLPDRDRPKQLHLGYVSLRTEPLQGGDRGKLTKALRERWRAIFNTDAVEIDWADADVKFRTFWVRCHSE
jgi:hypothetical protein